VSARTIDARAVWCSLCAVKEMCEVCGKHAVAQQFVVRATTRSGHAAHNGRAPQTSDCKVNPYANVRTRSAQCDGWLVDMYFTIQWLPHASCM
jgi:hypothetical protein